MTRILIDTNVLIYLFDQNEPEKMKRAQEVLDYLDASQLGCLSAQNLSEFINAATRKLLPPMSIAQAREQVSLFIRMWAVFDLTPMVVLEAARGVQEHQLSYYEAQIWAAARLNQVPLIFSEDFQDGAMLEGVRFANPFAPVFDLAAWA
jgi:predicted nucleic acid-binding protein